MCGKYKFLTVEEVAGRLLKMNVGDCLDFTFDDDNLIEEPTGWFGFKKVDIFNEPYGNIVMGDYGASATRIRSIQDNTIEEIAEIIQFWLDNEDGNKVEKLCIEIPVKELWSEFGDVLMNPDTECIEEDWNQFSKGTHREEIWLWFEEVYNICVARDLMGI